MPKDKELELSGPPPVRESKIETKEATPIKPKTVVKAVKSKKSELSKEYKEYLLGHFPGMVQMYGDVIEGENPAITEQRNRAVVIGDYLKSLIK